MYPRPRTMNPIALALIGLVVCVALFSSMPSSKPFLSNWVPPGVANSISQPGALAGALTAQVTVEAGTTALERYNQASQLHESVGDGLVRYYTRSLPNGGTLAYFVVMLDDQVHLEVINADGATPSSDETGNTIWADRQQHLATVEEMVQAPYSQRNGMQLLGAMAFGFHGGERTSNEGTVVINGTVHRINPWRATLCIQGHYAKIGLFDAEQVEGCDQAIGAGPVILWNGKVANTDVQAETDAFVPFNPLNEDFAQLDWRKKIYNGTYPKTVVGIGAREDGRSYLVMAVSNGVTGVELASQLRAMGCFSALGGDDDTSTQAIWRGNRVFGHTVREVPDAIGIYIR